MEIHDGGRHLINISTIFVKVILRYYFLSYVIKTACTLPVTFTYIFLKYILCPDEKLHDPLQF